MYINNAEKKKRPPHDVFQQIREHLWGQPNAVFVKMRTFLTFTISVLLCHNGTVVLFFNMNYIMNLRNLKHVYIFKMNAMKISLITPCRFGLLYILYRVID